MVGFVGGQPVGQTGFEALAAGLKGGQPDGLQWRRQLVRILVLGASAHAGPAPCGPGLQRSDGRLTEGAGEFDQFVEDFSFVFLAGASVAIPLLDQHFLSGQLTHLDVHGSVTPLLSAWGRPTQPTPPTSVTIFLSQIECLKFGFCCLPCARCFSSITDHGRLDSSVGRAED